MEPVADSFRVHPGVIVHAATGKEAPDTLLGLSAREVPRWWCCDRRRVHGCAHRLRQ
jgi:hypothetical protein